VSTDQENYVDVGEMSQVKPSSNLDDGFSDGKKNKSCFTCPCGLSDQKKFNIIRH